jgi:hypothetical protein
MAGKLSDDTHFLSSPEGGISQDRERQRASEGHSQAVKRRGRDVRTRKESEHARGTHVLLSRGRVKFGYKIKVGAIGINKKDSEFR